MTPATRWTKASRTCLLVTVDGHVGLTSITEPRRAEISMAPSAPVRVGRSASLHARGVDAPSFNCLRDVPLLAVHSCRPTLPQPGNRTWQGLFRGRGRREATTRRNA
jgi:hypothetical protein